MFKDLVLKNRSYRRFDQKFKIEPQALSELIDLARLSASAANLQPLKYITSSNSKTNALIFETLGWAGYLKDWPGPTEGERPSAYIIILGDTKISKNFGCDHGICAQSILLGAAEIGLGGCMIATIKKDKLAETLQISADYEILLVIAIGKPKECITLEAAKSNEIKYWRDSQGVHHVPKRSLEEIIIKQY
ncbi:MAG: nitroreductase family protein [Phycisphaerae bacterium]